MSKDKVDAAENVGVAVIRAAKPAEPVVEAAPAQQPLRVWATNAGHLPESFPGDKMRPVRNNRKAWIARAVCGALKLTPDDSIDEKTYLAAAAQVAAADAR
jgi:hypothetical protein